MLAQELEVDARLVVEALEVALRHQGHQVAVAGRVHREQQQVVDRVEAALVLRALLLLEAGAARDVGLAAEDRLHARGARLLVELRRAEQVAVVGHADRALPQLLHLREERRELDRAVEQRVLRVQVQMDESILRDQERSPTPGILASSRARAKRDRDESCQNREMMRRWVCLCLALACAGCATTEKLEEKVLAASPAPDSGFLSDAERMKPDPERAPFDRWWVSPTFEFKHYSKVYFGAVDTRHVLRMSLWDSLNIRAIDIKKDIANIALEFHADLERAFRADTVRHWEVLDDAKDVDAKTLVVQTAITSSCPTRPAWPSWARRPGPRRSSIGVPVGTFAAFTDQGSVAFEMRGRDGGTGEVVAMCADREMGAMRVVDLRTMTWYGNADQILESWSSELVELSNTSRDVQVKHSAYFTLMPW